MNSWFDSLETGRAGSWCTRERTGGQRTRCLPWEAHLALALVLAQCGVPAFGQATLTALVLALDLPEVLTVVKAGSDKHEEQWLKMLR